ncbi:protein JOKA2-like [Lactuca sativa]|uniref:protein JOKA2-like n=1 Tax=Lactuca sativa TaxID=4236 RepID=UPI0022AEA664|nr:protein JOKA2-like [Lactuca sativa]
MYGYICELQVKFGKTLRRFSASINDNNLALDTVALTEKIRSLFNFNPDVDFSLTYVDEDGDAVTLADDDDLRDVVRQSLNPTLRITIKLENGSHGGSSGAPNPTPTPTTFPMRRSQPQIPFGPIRNVLSEFLKSMPEPLHDQITKLPLELTSEATTSTPLISKLVEKMTHAYLNQISGSMDTPRAHTPSGESSTVKNNEAVVNPEATESSNSKKEQREGCKYI